MEPLSPQDPLHALLGKARPVEPRPNFTQNVMREIRQTPRSEGVWERLRAWCGGFATPRFALPAAALAVVIAGVALRTLRQADTDSPVVAQSASQAKAARQTASPLLHEVSASMILAATAETTPVIPTVEQTAPVMDMEDMDPMGLLAVQKDASALSDSELALLVY